MAKLIKSYENGIEKLELTFNGDTYEYSMLPTRYGRKGDKPTFDRQVADKHPELADNDRLMDALDSLSFEDDGGELVKIVGRLTRWEADQWTLRQR